MKLFHNSMIKGKFLTDHEGWSQNVGKKVDSVNIFSLQPEMNVLAGKGMWQICGIQLRLCSKKIIYICSNVFFLKKIAFSGIKSF